MSKKIATILFTIMIIAGCNTVSGFGQDVQHAGNAIERAAS